MVKPQKNVILDALILKDEHLTKLIISNFPKYASFSALKNHCKALELSCNGIVWLCASLAFMYLYNNKNLSEMQINLLSGLLVDLFIIAILKSLCRRKRPTVPKDMLLMGPDKFSFPSGHASRSSFVTIFFICLSPISKICWLPLICWCTCVCLSRILIQRHYLFDVIAGIAIGFMEAFLLNLVWINETGSQNILNYLLNDDVPIDLD